MFHRLVLPGLLLSVLAAAGCATPSSPTAPVAPEAAAQAASADKALLSRQSPFEGAHVMPMYARFWSEAHGEIKGSVAEYGHEGKVRVQGLSSAVAAPISEDTGAVLGKHVHHPITLIKDVDKASPLLFKDLVTGGRLTRIRIEYPRISPKGTEELYYVIELENARVTGIRSFVTGMDWTAFRGSWGHMEEVTLTYEKITVKWVLDGLEADDSWLSPQP